MFWQRDVIIPSQIKHSSCEWWPCRITMAKEFSEGDALLIFHFLHTRTTKHFARGDSKYFCSVPTDIPTWLMEEGTSFQDILKFARQLREPQPLMFLPQKLLQYFIIDDKSNCIAIICFINVKIFFTELISTLLRGHSRTKRFPTMSQCTQGHFCVLFRSFLDPTIQRLHCPGFIKHGASVEEISYSRPCHHIFPFHILLLACLWKIILGFCWMGSKSWHSQTCGKIRKCTTRWTQS